MPVAVKLKSFRQEGRFIVKSTETEPEKSYDVEIIHTEARELFNFYDKAKLLCSVYREYGAKYKVITMKHGDSKIYDLYEQALLAVKFKKTFKTKEEKQMSQWGVRLNIEDTTIDPKKKRDKDFIIQEEIIQKYSLIERHKVDHYLESKGFIVDIKCVEYNYKKKPTPIAGLVYEETSELIQSKESAILANIRSLSEVAMEIRLDWLDSKDYRVIQSWDEFIKIVQFLTTYTGVIAVDTETTGLSINRLPLWHPDRDNLTGICISWEVDKGIYIPVNQKMFNNLPEFKTLEALRFILENKHIVTHYGIFDWKVFWGYGIDLNICDDTYTLKFMTDPKGAKACKKLKEMTKQRWDIDQIELENFFPKTGKRKQKVSFDMLPFEAVEAYGPADTDFTLQHYYDLRPQLPKSMEYIYGQEIMLLRNIAYTEYYGIKIDLDELKAETEKEISKSKDLEQQIYRHVAEKLNLPPKPDGFIYTSYKEHKASKTDTPESLLREGIGFNISSSKQLGHILYNLMGIKPLAYTKKDGVETTTPSTSMKAFKMYEGIKNEDGSPKYPIMGLITAFKKSEKLITAFFNKMYKDILFLDYDKPKAERRECYIFPKYNPAGAESGRIAGYAPNLQQTAGSIRRLFVADSANHYIIDADYNQIEYRVMASLSQEESLMKKFEDPDVDFHTVMAAMLFGIPEEEVTPEKRKQSKALNFGIPYGMGDFSLAVQLYGKATEETIADAAAKKSAYLNSVPKLRDFFTVTKQYVQVRGYVETLFSRRRNFPEVFSGERIKVEGAKRQAGNTRIQGTAADIMKIAYNRVYEVLKSLGFILKTTKDKDGHCIPADPLFRVAGSIHDELLCVASKSINPWTCLDILKTCMEIKLKNFAPLCIGATVCNSWADGKDAKHEIPTRMLIKYLDDYNNKGMFREPFEDPEATVYSAIFDWANDIIIKGLEEAGFPNPKTATKKINSNYVMKVLTDKNIIGEITKYYGVKVPGTKNFDMVKSFENCLVKLYGEDMIYSDGEQAEIDYQEYEKFNESEEFAELMAEDDKILDEDIEGYDEEEISIDYKALNSQAIKAGTLKIETIKFADAKEEYIKTTRISVLNGKCYIETTGLFRDKFDKLADYIKEHHSDMGAYEVILDHNGKFIQTGCKLSFINRNELASILEKKNENVKRFSVK